MLSFWNAYKLLSVITNTSYRDKPHIALPAAVTSVIATESQP